MYVHLYTCVPFIQLFCNYDVVVVTLLSTIEIEPIEIPKPHTRELSCNKEEFLHFDKLGVSSACECGDSIAVRQLMRELDL